MHPQPHFQQITDHSKADLLHIMETAQRFKQPTNPYPAALQHTTVAHLFFEPSTRTQISFELAAQALSAQVIHMDTARCSHQKGESLLDTFLNLQAMGIQMFVVRHTIEATTRTLMQHATNTSIINAGEGCSTHPTQAMADMLTLTEHLPDLTKARVAIVGDILHSRVASSDIHALHLLGAQEIRVIAPEVLIPPYVSSLGVRVFHDLPSGLKDVDAIIVLRLQKERLSTHLNFSEQTFFAQYGITEERLISAPDHALILHPGPINRGLEISAQVADSQRSLILKQVSNGLAVRKAILYLMHKKLKATPGE